MAFKFPIQTIPFIEILFDEYHLSGFFAYLFDYNNKSMGKGTVKFFNETKGFGFIKEDESNKEYFVHVSGLVDQVKENDEVTFELEEGRKGLMAVSVKKA
jgi:CspA family cold shock protein